MALRYEANTDGTLKLVSSTFAQRKAARKAAPVGRVKFEVRHQGSVIATFENKQAAVAFTKAQAVNTEKFGWMLRPSNAAMMLSSDSSEPKCDIVAVQVTA